MSGERRPRLGVSACLLGQAVRYDGGHKLDPVVGELGATFEWVTVCPEVELGMGTPRPALQLVRAAGGLRMREVGSGRDHTATMRAFAARRVCELGRLDLSGFVLKAGSPSCGVALVAGVGAGGASRREGRGLFASALVEALPRLPVEDELHLHDPDRRAEFVARVFAYARGRA